MLVHLRKDYTSSTISNHCNNFEKSDNGDKNLCKILEITHMEMRARDNFYSFESSPGRIIV